MVVVDERMSRQKQGSYPRSIPLYNKRARDVHVPPVQAIRRSVLLCVASVEVESNVGSPNEYAIQGVADLLCLVYRAGMMRFDHDGRRDIRSIGILFLQVLVSCARSVLGIGTRSADSLQVCRRVWILFRLHFQSLTSVPILLLSGQLLQSSVL